MKKILFASIIGFLVFSCDYKSENDAYLNSYNSLDGAYMEGVSGEQYNEIVESPFIETSQEPVSTFSIDADGASYANCRRFLKSQILPPAYAIRSEEFINYFHYDYPEPENSHPIGVHAEYSTCPWAQGHNLLRIGIKGKDIPANELGASNFVLLIDVSGSMSSGDKLNLLKESFILFVNKMTQNDRIAIVTYAGQAGVALQSTNGSEKQVIIDAINALGSGGSTAGAQGIITAYEIAEQNFIEGGNNRVILGSDGDFNVGISDQESLIALIEEKRESGVYLTVLGVGTGNLNEGMMEQLANNGNGNFEYIDNIDQAKKVFLYDFKKFYTVANDVKVQLEFNPDVVQSYRLIGYENRAMENSEFNDDQKDAGEIGCNQTITALYEIIPVEVTNVVNLATIKINYKNPGETTSINFEVSKNSSYTPFGESSDNMRFASAAAAFAMLLFESDYIGTATFDEVIEWAENADIPTEGNFEEEFIDLVNMAKNMK
ncbi:MAG: VWA domain-containing protein [Bacteroidales bacterium]|nr:VWA domain-containing protein [Bacteroidales bacterium]MCF8458122.1 VWA domain-containing protein [Bacteroidales bacterium]